MKIVLAPDKFKDSLTGLEFCNAVKTGILNVMPEAEIILAPLADGGDGTIEVANYYLKGKLITVSVTNPLFKTISARYLYADSSKIACIEMAEASGLRLLNKKDRDCKNATTLGTGELILDAINRGAKEIILGIGGSATNDCGIGMAMALGYRFLDKNNKEVTPIGESLSLIRTIDDSNVNSKLRNVRFKVACDVNNPLYGIQGAAYVYACQKGATPKDIDFLDKGLQDFSKVLDAHFNIISQSIQGAGAAGGMGVATIAFLKGNLISGITLFKELANFDECIKDANWIITGEGKLDKQTLSGKTIMGILNSANQRNINVASFCGKLELDTATLKAINIAYVDDVISKAKNLEDAISNSYEYVKQIAENFAEAITS